MSERKILGCRTAELAQRQHELIMALCTALPRGYHGAPVGVQPFGFVFKNSFQPLKPFQQEGQAWHCSGRRENKNPKRRIRPDGFEGIINLMKPLWLVDWKPLPTFLDKRGLLGMEQ